MCSSSTQINRFGIRLHKRQNLMYRGRDVTLSSEYSSRILYGVCRRLFAKRPLQSRRHRYSLDDLVSMHRRSVKVLCDETLEQ
jgi:hypothetical protein